jgi:outer membrane protein assembly factor BamB
MRPEEKIEMIKSVSFVWSCDGYAIMCDVNGSEMWRKTLKLEHEKHFDARQVTVLLKLFTSGPRKGEGYVFAGFNRFAIAMDATTGDTVWIHTFDESFNRGPVTFAVYPKTPVIYVASKGKIKGIFADDGTKKWSRNLPGTGYDVVNMCIGASKEELFAGTRGAVLLLNGENGEIIWQKQIKSSRFGQSTSACHTCVCLCDNGHQLVYGMHGRLGGLAARTGDPIWERKIKKLECTDSLVPLLMVPLRNRAEEQIGGLASPSLATKQYVFAASAGVMYCVDPQQSNGEAIVWERDLFAGIKLAIEQPALAFEGNKVFVAMAAHCIALEPYTGEILWATYLPNLNCSCMTLVSQAPGTLSVAAIGCIQVLNTENGAIEKTLIEEPRVGRNAMICLAGIGYDTEMNSNPMQQAAASIEGLGKDFRGVAPKKRGDLTEMWAINRQRYEDRRVEEDVGGSTLTADMVSPTQDQDEPDDDDEDDFFNAAAPLGAPAESPAPSPAAASKKHEEIDNDDDDGWGFNSPPKGSGAASQNTTAAADQDDDMADALAAIDEIDDFFGGGESAPVAKTTPVPPPRPAGGAPGVAPGDLLVGESVDDLLSG